ncbi:MAG: oxidoreductase [Alphaproteobacteria bacterium]|nr:MAG: oxidoreductase [Alphaproteobacteria bacterium]
MYMVTLQGTQEQFECKKGEPILRAGLRAGFGLPYECSVGGCGTCKFDVLEGQVEMLWPEAPGLSDRDKRKGRMLACQAVPLEDCIIKMRLDKECIPPVLPVNRSVGLIERYKITHDIEAFRFKSEGPAIFKAGQYALLTSPKIEGARAYSMSNLSNDEGIWEFQIRNVPEGLMTRHLFDQINIGDKLELDGPYGVAFFKNTGRDVVCVAGGSGLAPMVSIAKAFSEDPACKEHTLHFLYGARTPSDVCGEDMLQELAGFGDRIFYHAIVSNPETLTQDEWDGPVGLVHTHIYDVLDGNLQEYEYYFAGPPKMATAIDTLLLEKYDVASSQLHYDRFF